MGYFDDKKSEKQSGGKLEQLEPVKTATIDKLRRMQPGLPIDFTSFLQELGSGEINKNTYVIYQGFLEPNEIYDQETAEELDGILLFGDDMQGYCNGFDTKRNWCIVEIDPTNMSYEKTHENFSDFIRSKLKEL